MLEAWFASASLGPRLIPRGEAMAWTPSLLGLDLLFNLLMSLAYAALLGMLTATLRARPALRDIHLVRALTVLLFTSTLYYLQAIWTVWFAHYQISVLVHGLMTCAVVATALLVRRHIDEFPRIPSATQAEQMRRELINAEVDVQRGREELLALQRTLDTQVKDRTSELAGTNRLLQSQIEGLRRAEREFLTEKERALVTLRAIADGVISADTRGRITYLNPVAERITGWSSAEAIGRPVSEVFKRTDESTRTPLPDPVTSALEHEELSALPSQSRLVNRYGQSYSIEDLATPIRDHDGTIKGVVLVFHDVSAARKMANRMSYLAQHDQLTGLPNRTLLNDRLNRAISHARRDGDRVALMFMDIDRFKQINDSRGHLVGDQLLKLAARRLERCVRASDTVSRQGGDEFVILLPEVRDEDAPAEVARKVLAAMARPFQIDGGELLMTVSLGIALFPDDGDGVEEVTRNADSAMYHAKANGRNNFQFFTSTVNRRLGERMAMQRRLRDALQRGEFEVHYQPRVALNDGSIIGAEALLRWNHPSLGLIAPGQFIEAAEESGLIVPIGRWVIEQACRQSSTWRREGLPPLPIAVNLSQAELTQRSLLDEIRPILAQADLAPGALEFEMSESAAQSSPPQALQGLHDLGIRLAIDDFGAGAASLSTLRRLPIDAIRIDRTLMHAVPAAPSETAAIRSMLGMTHGLQLRAAAKGIENLEQLQFLRQQGCDEGQGFLFGQPLKPADFERLFDGNRSAVPA